MVKDRIGRFERNPLAIGRVCLSTIRHWPVLRKDLTAAVLLRAVNAGNLVPTKYLPPRLAAIIERLHLHAKYLDEQIGQLEGDIARQLADDDIGQRLLTIPGVGVITASVLASEMGDGKQYRCGRDFAAAIGRVPRQHNTGGRTNLLGISRRGDKNIRRLHVTCARAYMIRLGKQTGRLADWVRSMMTRRHSNVVACALADKLARTAWAIVTHHTVFDAQSPGVAA